MVVLEWGGVGVLRWISVFSTRRRGNLHFVLSCHVMSCLVCSFMSLRVTISFNLYLVVRTRLSILLFLLGSS